MLISSKTTLCQGCFQTFGGQCIYIYIYIYPSSFHYIFTCNMIMIYLTEQFA